MRGRLFAGVSAVIVKSLIFIAAALTAWSAFAKWSGVDLDIPYKETVLLMVILSLGLDMAEILLLWFFSMIFRVKESLSRIIVTVGAKDLFETFLIIISGGICFFNPVIGMGIFFVFSLLLVVIEYNVFYNNFTEKNVTRLLAFLLSKACIIGILYGVICKIIFESYRYLNNGFNYLIQQLFG